MITIPTSDLVGLLTDVIPFACPDDDIPMLHAVRIAWDGKQLHTQATDRYRLGWATWQPFDIREGQEAQDDLFTEWGGADDEWAVCVTLPEAKEIASVFALGKKENRVPVTVDYDLGQRRLRIQRSRDTGHSAITIDTEDAFLEFPNLAKMLEGAPAPATVGEVAYWPKALADFGKVRPDGPMRLRFTDGLTHVTIGDRFVGAISPVIIKTGEGE